MDSNFAIAVVHNLDQLGALVRQGRPPDVLGLDDGMAGVEQLLAYGNAFSVISALLRGLARVHNTDGDYEQLHYEHVSGRDK